jgi:hypothetical protein
MILKRNPPKPPKLRGRWFALWPTSVRDTYRKIDMVVWLESYQWDREWIPAHYGHDGYWKYTREKLYYYI